MLTYAKWSFVIVMFYLTTITIVVINVAVKLLARVLDLFSLLHKILYNTWLAKDVSHYIILSISLNRRNMPIIFSPQLIVFGLWYKHWLQLFVRIAITICYICVMTTLGWMYDEMLANVQLNTLTAKFKMSL